MKCIDDKKYTWIQIVNIPKILQHDKTYLHLSAKKGQTEKFEKKDSDAEIFRNEY